MKRRVCKLKMSVFVNKISYLCHIQCEVVSVSFTLDGGYTLFCWVVMSPGRKHCYLTRYVPPPSAFIRGRWGCGSTTRGPGVGAGSWCRPRGEGFPGTGGGIGNPGRGGCLRKSNIVKIWRKRLSERKTTEAAEWRGHSWFERSISVERTPRKGYEWVKCLCWSPDSSTCTPLKL